MKSIQHLASFIFVNALLLSACASPRLVTLADGTKVPAHPTYLSAKDMAARGKNPYGVPETSFAFYPEKWEPGEKNEAGRSKEEHLEYAGALLKARGERADYIPFCPGGVPSWDRSCGDPPHIRHDCFSVERLFVVPWGSGEGEVGLMDKGADPKTGWRWIPSVKSVGGLGSNIEVTDHVTERILIFSWNGRYLGERRAVGDEYKRRDCDPRYGGQLTPQGYGMSVTNERVNVYQPGDALKSVCKVYLPQASTTKSDERSGDPTKYFFGEQYAWALTDCTGFTYQVPTQEGVEIYFYRAR